MGRLWQDFGPGVDDAGRKVKEGLLRPYAQGIVLDLGAGHGHTVHYLDRTRVTQYVALEPNVHMHDELRKTANAAGFTESDGSLLILPFGAEETEKILLALSLSPSPPLPEAQIGPRYPGVDTLVSILTLCTIPHPRETISKLVQSVLRPGGQLLYYEHVLSPRSDVAWWQRVWAPIWALAFDGCRLDRPTHVWVEEIHREGVDGNHIVWKERAVWGKEGESEESLFWHRVGRYVKA